MAGILSALGQVTNILYETNENGLTGKALLDALESKDVQLMKTDGSIMKLLGNFIVEPVAVVSNNLRDDEIMDKVLGLHTDLFTGFYMQAYAVLTSVYQKDTQVAVDVLGTDNGGLERVFLRGARIAIEDRDFTGELFSDDFSLSTEAPTAAQVADRKATVAAAKHQEAIKKMQDELTATQKAANNKKDKGGNSHNVETSLHKGFKDLYIPNAIQRTIEVTVTQKSDDGKGVAPTVITIPITIKTHVIYTDIDNIINTLQPNSDDKGFFNRVDEYRAGAISLADLTFTSDLIQKYKKNKLKDKDKLLELIQARKLSANSKMASKGAPFPGFEKYYNMFIISAEDKVRVEKHLRGKISKGSNKQKFLDQGYGLSLTVMDQDYERVQMHIRDLRGDTDLTYKSVSKIGKDGTDQDELIKALMAGRQPSF